MTLPKHLRPRWRYLAVEIRSSPDVQVTREAFEEALTRSVRALLGDVGCGRTDPRVLRFDYMDGRGDAIVRTHRDTVEDVRAALACLADVKGDHIGTFVCGVSGTVRACEEKYLGRETEELPENTVVFEGAERSAVMRGSDIDVRVGDAYIGATRLDLE